MTTRPTSRPTQSDLQRVRERAAAAATSQALAVHGICERAGRLDLAAGFIKRGLTAVQAQREIASLSAKPWGKAFAEAQKPDPNRIVLP